jgi:hypothetical protein
MVDIIITAIISTATIVIALIIHVNSCAQQRQRHLHREYVLSMLGGDAEAIKKLPESGW